MDVDNRHFIFIRANTIFLFFLPLILFESGASFLASFFAFIFFLHFLPSFLAFIFCFVVSFVCSLPSLPSSLPPSCARASTMGTPQEGAVSFRFAYFFLSSAHTLYKSIHTLRVCVPVWQGTASRRSRFSKTFRRFWCSRSSEPSSQVRRKSRVCPAKELCRTPKETY